MEERIKNTMLKKELTGYLMDMVAPLKACYTSSGAGLHTGAFAAGYGMRIADMEGFARVLWGLTPLYKGIHGEYKCLTNDSVIEIMETYRKGLVAGTNPNHPDYWGDIGHRDQRMVEMASLSLNLLMTPDWIWETLTVDEQKQIGKWLYQINAYELPENNWQFFNVITNVALKKCGLKYSQERMNEGIEAYESFYLGEGWYGDGVRPQKDYYVSFGIHFYCLLYATYMKEEDPTRCAVYLERAKTFASSFLYWFDEKGRGLPFGRSMTYRFAQVAFWSIFATVIEEEQWLGIAKGIIARHFRYWMKQPIVHTGGNLSVGYTYPNLTMSEGYNAPGSPYWAFKSFYCLSLPDHHPFWKAEERPLPIRHQVFPIKEADMIMQHYQSEVVALTSGQFPTVYHTHSHAKYAKFAYSSNYGFSVPRSMYSLQEAAPDSMLAFVINGQVYVRGKSDMIHMSEKEICSRWTPYPGIDVITTLVPIENGHRRTHVIKSTLECIAYDSGFAYPVGMKMMSEQTPEYARIVDDHGYSQIASGDGRSYCYRTAPNTNIIYPLTGIPSIEYTIRQGEQIVTSEVTSWMEEGTPIIGKGDCYGLYVDRK